MFQERGTIAAIATPAGVGGVAMIRVSGSRSVEICDQLFKPAKGLPLNQRRANSASYGVWRFEEREIDDVVVTLFRAPHSYTGEETIEVSCHGSTYIQQKILESLIGMGCRMATPGEFTQRSFLNGRMDLSQAEAVADLIASSSSASHRLALNQMRGGFGRELNLLRAQLLELVSLIELELDFSEEEVEFADRERLNDLVNKIECVINRLVCSFKAGNAIKNGIPVAIVGETNVGKSTLLNRLLNEEKAIVSEIHGTTRDVIEDTVNINGITFRFIDTAGIRETADKVETLGIRRTFEKISQAHIILWIVDGMQQIETIKEMGNRLKNHFEEKQWLMVVNKNDLLSNEKREELMKTLAENGYIHFMSAKNDLSIAELESKLYESARLPELNETDVVVTNLRHYEALTHSLTSLHRVREGIHSGLSGDFISQDLRETIHHLGLITGEISTDEVLGSIFGKFCIGK